MKISVVTVCFNSAHTIRGTLSAVAAQEGADCEHVVIDGASTDGTVEIVEGFRPEVARFISEPDGGLYDAMNKGIAAATGEVVGFLNSDDMYAGPDVLQKVTRAFASANVDAVYGDLVYVKRDDMAQVVRYWRSCAYSPGLVERGWMPAHPTFFVRTSILREMGGFDTRYRYQSDFELMIRLFAKRGIATVYIPEILVRMRTGGHSNRSLRNVVRGNLESYSAARAHGIATSPLWIARKLSYRVGSFFARPVSPDTQRPRGGSGKP